MSLPSWLAWLVCVAFRYAVGCRSYFLYGRTTLAKMGDWLALIEQSQDVVIGFVEAKALMPLLRSQDSLKDIV